MSIYTLKFKNLVKDDKYDDATTLLAKIDLLRQDVFNFDYTTPSLVGIVEFKTWFERLFIARYFNDEIAFETLDEFTFNLYAKMMEIMPKYNKQLDLFYSINNESFLNKSTTTNGGYTLNTNTNAERKTDNVSGERVTTTTQSQRVSQSKTIGSDLPINLINADNIDDVSYATNGSINNTTSQPNEDTSTTNSYTDSTTNYAYVDTQRSDINTNSTTISGNLFQYLNTYNSSLKNVIDDLFNEFEPLFMWIF